MVAVCAEGAVEKADAKSEGDADPELEIAELCQARVEEPNGLERRSRDQHGRRLSNPVVEAGIEQLPRQHATIVDGVEVVEMLVRVSEPGHPGCRVRPGGDDFARREYEPNVGVGLGKVDHALDAAGKQHVVCVEVLEVAAAREVGEKVVVADESEIDPGSVYADARVRE